MQKTIMIIGAGILQVPAIEKAKEMGLFTIITDYDPLAKGMPLADMPVIMSTKDIEGTVRIAREISQQRKIDGVITVGTDASMTVAAVANALGLPGIKFENAEASSNKLKMRRRFEEHKIPSPKFSEVWSVKDAKRIADKLGFPLVIKPSDNMGARGVMRIDSMDGIEEAFRHAKANSPSGELILEEYMDGPELSIDALIFDGEIIFVGIADRIIGYRVTLGGTGSYDPLAKPIYPQKEEILKNPENYPPFFVEIGHDMPSRQPKDIIKQACSIMKAGIYSLGIDIGAAKGDIKLTSEGPKIGEIGARLSGGFMSAYTYPLHSGFSSIKAAIEIALGMKPKIPKKFLNKVSIERAIIPVPGEIKSITGIDEALKIRGVAEIYLRNKEGDKVYYPQSNMDKAGNIIVYADNYIKARNIMKKTFRTIKIEVGPPSLIDEKEILKTALRKFHGTCFICPICNGIKCAGQMPGMGSVGSGKAFIRNIEALAKYNLNINVIHSVREPDLSINFLGYKLSMPVMVAPITGTTTNMGGGMSEEEYVNAVIEGAKSAGTIAFVGDGATPTKYLVGIEAIRRAGGMGIPIFKPRIDDEKIITRIRAAEKVQAIAVGMDVDAISFVTMVLKGEAVGARDVEDYKKIIKSTKLPFVMKGIMTPADALKAKKSGSKVIIVSNHGGRVLDSLSGTLEVLPQICKTMQNYKIEILIDGGIRGGEDVLKCLALGAKAVLIGRPVAIYAYGGGADGVKYYLEKIKKELAKAMVLTGCKHIRDINPSILTRVD
ncbi:MAG: alpha-hydroxy-acid oxidizing protein [Candidatus Hydrogenedentota bacterium]